MKKSKVVTHSGIAVDLASIKAIKIDGSKTLVFLHKNRYDFVFNPGTNEYEKVLIEDSSDYECYSFENAQALQMEWEQIWQDYLNDE
jgi:hypothetical protein